MSDNFILYSRALERVPKEDISFINSITKDTVFKCFSLNLYKKLIGKGFCPICKTIHSKTNLYYTIFLKSDELMEVVTEFSQDSKTRSEYRIKTYGSDISYTERQKLKQKGGEV